MIYCQNNCLMCCSVITHPDLSGCLRQICSLFHFNFNSVSWCFLFFMLNMNCCWNLQHKRTCFALTINLYNLRVFVFPQSRNNVGQNGTQWKCVGQLLPKFEWGSSEDCCDCHLVSVNSGDGLLVRTNTSQTPVMIVVIPLLFWAPLWEWHIEQHNMSVKVLGASQ